MKRLRPALSVDDWIRLNRLLEQGLDLDEDKRSSWLEQLTSESEHVRAALYDLIGPAAASAIERDARQSTAIARVASDALAALHPDHPGHQIGPWRLERLLAEGGMGSVWLAERADGVMRRTAALKLPRSEWVDRGLSERIARERAILARLQHPNIAVLYDAGVTSEGRPYLALEYVEGDPIDVYCRDKRLGLTQLLQLVLPVVRAVAYAHSRLIIHRDIKPGNILVTPGGQPKLLDFGVSKLIEGEKTAAEETALTQVIGRPLTLPYAAPEQLLGAPATVALDVYALGVVLFELVTGTRLYQSTTHYALEQEVIAGDLRRPSDATSDRRRKRELHGDLDAIILNALKKRPEDRYDSATAFADDLERYLAGKPVRARPDSRKYRVRKFVARNRHAVVAAGAITFAVAAGAGVALWQANIARAQAAEAMALNALVLSLITQVDPHGSQQTKQADLATLAAIEQRIDGGFLASPSQLLRVRVTLGDAYQSRGHLVAARRAYGKAADDATGRVAPDDVYLLQAYVRAADPMMIASVQDAHRLARTIDTLRAKLPASAELLIEALIIRHVLSDEFGLPEFTSLNHRFDALGEALDVAYRHFGEGSEPYLRAVLPYSYLVDQAGDRPHARRLIEDALNQARQRLENYFTSAAYRRVDVAHHAYLCGTERASDGITGLWHTLDAVRASHEENSVQLEELYDAIGLCYERMGDSRSLWFYRAAYDVAAAREQPPSVQLIRRAARVMDWAVESRDTDTAEQYRQKALENFAVVSDPVLRAKFSRKVAMDEVCLLYYLGKADEAERAGLEVSRAWRDEPHARLTYTVVKMMRCLSFAQRELGRFADAARTAQDLLEQCHAYGEAGHVRCRNRGMLALALVRLDEGNATEALAILDERSKLPLRRDLNPESVLARARALLALGRTADAMPWLHKLEDYWNASSRQEGPFAAEARYWLGQAYVASGDARGRPMISEAKRTLASSPMASHRELAARP